MNNSPEKMTLKEYTKWYFRTRGPIILFAAVVAIIVKLEVIQATISWWGNR